MGTSYGIESGNPGYEGVMKVVMTLLSGLGIFAVPIFLFLSGCFFAYAANKDDLKRNYKIVRANLLHVLMPFFIWSIIFYLEIYLLHDQSFTIWGYIKNLLVGFPYHFVPLLAFFYLISPILIRLSKFIGGWTIVVLIGALQLFLLNIEFAGILGFEFPIWVNRLVPPVLSSSLAEWGIFFPLGLFYVKSSSTVLPVLQKARWFLVVLTAGLYLVATLDVLSVINVPLARFLCPMTFMLITPTVQRNSIPFVRSLEQIGKKAYGLYLMNLLVLDSILFAIQTFIPGLLGYYLLLLPVLFILTLEIPMLIMRAADKNMKPVFNRYVFG